MPDLSQVVDWSAIPPSSQGTLPDAPSGASSQFPGLYGRYDEDVNALKAAAPALQPVVPQPTDYSATTAIKRLAGLDGEERYMLWPEKVVREGLSAAHDVSQPNPYQQGTEDYELYEQARQAAMIPAAVSMSALAGTGGLAAPSDATLGSGAFLRPALKYEGRIYKAPIKDPKNPAGFGAEHSDALPAHLADDFYKKAMTGDDINSYQFGFMNHKGQFMPREAALDYAVKEGLINPHDARYGTLTSTMLADSSKPGTAIEALAKQHGVKLRTKFWGPNTGRDYTHTGIEYREHPYDGSGWKFGLDEDGTPWISGSFVPSETNLVRALQDYFNPLPEDTFIRTTWNKSDYDHLLNGTHLGSMNHATGKAEAGLSVAKHPELPQKYAYFVKGKQIGTGSDGEPILDLDGAKPVSKLLKYNDLVSQFDVMRRQKVVELGLSPAQERALLTSKVVLSPENYMKYRAGSEIIDHSGTFDTLMKQARAADLFEPGAEGKPQALKQGGFTNLGVDPARDPVTGAYVGTVPKFKGRDQGGRFQKAVDPYRNLPDINAETFGEAEAKKAERYRINGKFATTADYFRQRVPTDEELTKIRQNEFYNDKNAPSKEELDKIIDRLHQANPDVDPAAVEAWKKKMPFSTFADSSKPGTVIEVLKSPNNQIAMDFVDKLSKKLKEAYPDVEPTAEAWSNKLRAMFEKENGK